MKPFIKFLGYIFIMLYLFFEVLYYSLRLIRLLIAGLVCLHPDPEINKWGRAQWWAFNVDTAALGWGTMYRTVSGLAAERARDYPRYVLLRDFIDFFSYKGHCEDHYQWELKYSVDAYEASKVKRK